MHKLFQRGMFDCVPPGIERRTPLYDCVHPGIERRAPLYDCVPPGIERRAPLASIEDLRQLTNKNLIQGIS